jgi:WD40 repeat protein
MLALVTRSDVEHHLQIFEVPMRDRRAMTINTLKHFKPDTSRRRHSDEVNWAAFSADGIYLALARSDNRTHVYDTRMLERLLYDFTHNGPCKCSPDTDNPSYGVVKGEWIVPKKTGRFGLVTGGDDGAYSPQCEGVTQLAH